MIAINGTYDPVFQPVVDRFRAQLERYGGGGSFCLYQAGQPVIDIWGGTARADGSQWEPDTMAIGFSCSKGISIAAFHILAARGLVDYDAPVADYWPEFGSGGKGNITVRELLSHQAGLYKMRGVVGRVTDILDWDTMARRLAAAEPDHAPGDACGYHAFTIGWLVGELIQRISGKPLAEFLEDELKKPLGLHDVYVGTPISRLENVADLIGFPPIRRDHGQPFQRQFRAPGWVPPGPLRRILTGGFHPQKMLSLFTHPDFFEASIPAANGVFSARALARIYAVFAEGGTLDGAQLYSPQQVQQIGEVQTTAVDRVIRLPMNWRLGFHRTDAAWRPVPDAFGHYGFAGSGGWANPRLRLAGALIHNGNPLTVAGQARTAWLTGEVYKSLGVV